jgi:hypothetical protein
MITGTNLLALVAIALLIYFLFFSPAQIPSWLRTVFIIVLAVVAFVWLLNLLGVLVF